MKKSLILTTALLLNALMACVCHASNISLRIKPGFSYSEGQCLARVRIVNKGDEPAMAVRVNVETGGRSLDAGFPTQLDINKPFTGTVSLGNAPIPAGIHTAIIRAYYEDANGYASTALKTLQLVTAIPDPIEDPVGSELSSIEINRRSEITLSLTSSAQEAVAVKARLVLPSEFTCEVAEHELIIPPGKTLQIPFKITNTSGREGSVYALYAIADYKYKGLHRSNTTASRATVTGAWTFPSLGRSWWLTVIIPLIIGFVALQFIGKTSSQTPDTLLDTKPETARALLLTPIILTALIVFLGYYIRPSLLFLDTMTTGGDTPAHNYLASHCGEQLFGQGRVVSWGDGWWCGFPMFQYYFCLPYLLSSLMDLVMPFNVAFKLVSVLGIFALPLVAYAVARIMRLSRPIPVLLSVAAMIFLFDRSHTMWGLNINSTLAGMISASISFPLMLLFLAFAARDMNAGRTRISTVLLLSAVVASHFFSALLAVITVSIIPFLKPRAGTRRAILVLVKEGCLVLLLTSWWLIPLITKTSFSMNFGINWDVPLFELKDGFPFVSVLFLPPVSMAILPFAVFAVIMGLIRCNRFVMVMLWLFAVSTILFLVGYNLVSRVFVNVRLWPFMHFSLLALGACGVGFLLERRRATGLAVCALTICALAFGIDKPHFARSWAEWNYEGLKSKPGQKVFDELIRPLDGTPGRLANDLHPANHAGFGSTRFFEAVPHIIRKPVLEGGIVNSAVGSMLSYYIQGETSDNCAGYPDIVIPTSFNITNATKHLELCNVKHFIARSQRTRAALADSEHWKSTGVSGGWELFELTSHDGRYVIVPDNHPVKLSTCFKTETWKEDLLEWVYETGAIDQPFILSPKRDSASSKPAGNQMTRAQYRQYLYSRADNNGDIREWLLLGPFGYPLDTPDPIDFSVLPSESFDPREGQHYGNKTWRLTPSRMPVEPTRFFRRKDGITGIHDFITYGFVNVFSPSNKKIFFYYSCDDAIKIWLNDNLLVASPNTGSGNFRKAEASLIKGRNRLLVKCQQAEGGHFFRVRIADANGMPFSEITASIAADLPELPKRISRRIDNSDISITEEEVSSRRIRFRTSAVGLPHIIKCTYFPNWKVKGADKVHMVTPGFMLVYPSDNEVELYYSHTLSDNIGRSLTLLGLMLVIVTGWSGIRSSGAKPKEKDAGNPVLNYPLS